MTKLALEDSLINYKRGHLSLEAILVIVEAYSSATNNAKPIVSRAYCECEVPKPMARCMDDRVYCNDCRNAVKQYDR